MWWARLLNVVSGLLGTPTPVSTNSYESIATVTVGAGGASTVSFTSIPSTYKHLQVRAILRSTYAGSTDFMSMKFNSDGTAANYTVHKLQGNGASASASASVGDFYLPMDYPANTATSGVFGTFVIDILDYANTTKNKTSRILAGYDANGSGSVYLDSSLWLSTSAINSITFQDYTVYGGNYAQYSSFALYGIKG
jgi:hypothetical protein